MANTHSALTVAQFQTQVQTSAVGRMADMNSAQFLNFLNQALANKYSELVKLIPGTYRSKTTLSVSGYTVSLPTDYKRGQVTELYTDENSEDEQALMPSTLYTEEAGVLRFNNSQSDSYYLRYTLNESQYSSADDAVPETADIQARLMLQEEIKALYYEAQADGESTGSSQNALSKSNRLS